MWKFRELARVLQEDGILHPEHAYRPSIPPLEWVEMVSAPGWDLKSRRMCSLWSARCSSYHNVDA
jgi:hypothetical protein